MRSKKPPVLNLFLVRQIEAEGVEVKKFKGAREREQGVSRVNPLEKLFDDNKISREQFAVAENYQKKFAEANKSNHARPSLIYSGLPRSAASTKPNEPTPADSHLKAANFCFYVKQKLATASAPRQIDGFKNFKTPGVKKFSRELRLIDILEKVFEEEKSIRSAELLLGINHAKIEDRIIKICDIMLELSRQIPHRKIMVDY
jgi:hypothetical protein